MEYQVRIIDDHELPCGVGWAFVRQDGCLRFLLKESAARDIANLAETLEDAWAFYRRIEDHELFSWPSDLSLVSMGS